jgi:hypothetical protein
MSHEDDRRGLVGGKIPFEVVLRPEDPLGIDRGVGLGYNVSNHFFSVKKGVNGKNDGSVFLIGKGQGELKHHDRLADCQK